MPCSAGVVSQELLLTLVESELQKALRSFPKASLASRNVTPLVLNQKGEITLAELLSPATGCPQNCTHSLRQSTKPQTSRPKKTNTS